MAAVFGNGRVLRISSVSGEADGGGSGAMHEEPPAAELALSACIHRVHRDAVADTKPGHSGAKLNHFARKLMPENKRYGSARPLMGSGRHIQWAIHIFVKVGMA
jgi:hypothetical protein